MGMHFSSEGYVRIVTYAAVCCKLLVVTACLLSGTASAGTTDIATMPDRLKLGIVTSGDVQARDRVEPFRVALEEIADLPVDLFLFDTLGQAVEALAASRIDYARLSPSAYAATYQICNCVEPLVTAAPDDFPARFYAVMIATRQDQKASVEELKGTSLGTGGRETVAGYRVPVANLAADGINVRTHFRSLVEVGDPLEGLKALLDGRVQASFGWSTLVGDAKNGYTAGTLNDFYVSGAGGFNKLEIVWRSAPIPYSAHTLRKDVPDVLKRQLRAGLMELRREAPDAYLAIEPDLPGGFEPVTHSDYRPVLLTYDEAYVSLMSSGN